MITRSWKNIVGVISSCNRRTAGSNMILRVPISGLFDVDGRQHNDLIARIAPSGTGQYISATATGFNQATLFNSFSTNTNMYLAECLNAQDWQLCGGKSKIVFGTGSTPFKYTNYALESPINEGITGVEYYVARSYNEDTNAYEAIITATFTSSIDTTISEVGVVKSICNVSSYSDYEYASYYYNVLAAREVLETPIEVKAGETFTVSIKIDI